ncbi:hypothetical protein HHI36_006788 [Cryptolaemus montrouzieri]|uniref:Uncharacterized protein n=1 Tax=Cryptolaemus montrouzieri TaxID=559131 RepID=A0ABD2NYH9_9CUCU
MLNKVKNSKDFIPLQVRNKDISNKFIGPQLSNLSTDINKINNADSGNESHIIPEFSSLDSTEITNKNKNWNHCIIKNVPDSDFNMILPPPPVFLNSVDKDLDVFLSNMLCTHTAKSVFKNCKNNT